MHYAEGTKNVAKEIKKIAHGAKKLEGVSWWPELSDKCKVCKLYNKVEYMYFHAGKSTKVHMYWAMKNCTGSAEDLRQKIMNTSKHYQVNECMNM